MLSRRVPITLVALALAGCGGDAPERSPGGAQEAQADVATELHHIHGLGVDPADGTLFVATHAGLFASARGSTEIERVGDSRQDLMGFSVAASDRFIASGHPAPGQTELPPNLGLIVSTDKGRTWRTVSLTGEADFHALESSGERVYGFDGTRARLMVSDDGGREWREREPPAPIFDLAIDPDDRDRTLAATERGLYASRDAGESWRNVRDDMAGLLAWSDGGAVYLLDGRGSVARSEDGGRSWESRGSLGGQPAAFLAHGDDLYGALADGTVQASSDGGRTWTLRAAP